VVSTNNRLTPACADFLAKFLSNVSTTAIASKPPAIIKAVLICGINMVSTTPNRIPRLTSIIESIFMILSSLPGVNFYDVRSISPAPIIMTWRRGESPSTGLYRFAVSLGISLIVVQRSLFHWKRLYFSRLKTVLAEPVRSLRGEHK